MQKAKVPDFCALSYISFRFPCLPHPPCDRVRGSLAISQGAGGWKMMASFRPSPRGGDLLPAQSYTANLLLSRLDEADFALLQPHLKRVTLSRGDELIGADTPIEFIHFLESGVSSMVADHGDTTIEVGLTGLEGFVGVPVLLGTETSPDRSFIQIGDATALRLPVKVLMGAVAESDALRLTLLRYIHVLSVQAARTAASNAVNELPQRLARWLLMCHDRVDGDGL